MGRGQRLLWLGVSALLAAGVGGAAAAPSPTKPLNVNSKRVCAYSGHSLTSLQHFGDLLGRQLDCAMVYNDTATDWRAWERPWFLSTKTADNQWGRWVERSHGRKQLIISQSLTPKSELQGHWRAAGASGFYEAHAQTLARNLVRAGLGRSIIRLSAEANFPRNPNFVGSDAVEIADWRAFWANTVRAMRSVGGAHFQFDWCINASGRPLPLRELYPGSDVVDIVGLDVYDFRAPAGNKQWPWLYSRRDGIAPVARFARAQGKPFSLPEWALTPSDKGGVGEDPAFVAGIASVVQHNTVAYQSYFYSRTFATLLDSSPDAIAALRDHFGPDGDAV